jgi:hypothetical protein
MPIINFRITEEEQKKLKEKAAKTNSTMTDMCKRLVLGYEVENITSVKTIQALIELWQEMSDKKISQDILDKLKKIILEAE